MDIIFGLVGLIFVLAVTFLPAIIACYRKHGRKWWVVAVNVCFGWTVLGWAIALLWAMIGARTKSV